MLRRPHATSRTSAATRAKDVDCSARDGLGRPHPDERRPRLPVANLWLERLDLLGQDVGRIRDDEIPRPGGEPRVEIPLAQLDREPRPERVRPGDLERARRRVDSGHERPRMLVRDRERDRAAARPDVEDARLGEAGDPREAALDHDLGLGSRDEHAPIDAEREPPEAPLTEHVREGLACLASGDQPLERLLLRPRQLARGLERELRPRQAEHVRDENLGVDAGRVATGRRETFARLVDRPPGLHAEAAASAWRCSSARSASVSSPMSPSSTWSSRCSVSLTR